MITKIIKLYEFSELSESAKEKAIDEWYENEDYPLLSEDLTESCKALLEENNVIIEKIKLLYSLSYSQGDGLCFIGSFVYNNKQYTISHSWRYYFSKSVDIIELNLDNDEENELSFKNDQNNEFIKIYLDVCNKIEKKGYDILEYRMNDKEFSELCQANNYYFTESGKLD